MLRHSDTDDSLSERELYEFTDLLAMRIYHHMGRRCYMLSRQDIVELIRPYVSDLSPDDRRALSWLVWNLLQEGAELEHELDQV